MITQSDIEQYKASIASNKQVYHTCEYTRLKPYTVKSDCKQESFVSRLTREALSDCNVSIKQSDIKVKQYPTREKSVSADSRIKVNVITEEHISKGLTLRGENDDYRVNTLNATYGIKGSSTFGTPVFKDSGKQHVSYTGGISVNGNFLSYYDKKQRSKILQCLESRHCLKNEYACVHNNISTQVSIEQLAVEFDGLYRSNKELSTFALKAFNLIVKAFNNFREGEYLQ